MIIKSELPFNTILSGKRNAKTKGTNVTLEIISGATHSLSDADWKKFEESAEPLLASGALVYVQAPALTEAEQAAKDAKDLKEAEAKAAAIKKRQEATKTTSK